MTNPPTVVLDLMTFGCEGCIYLSQRNSDPRLILSGEVPCFECEAKFFHTGMRVHKISMEPEASQEPQEMLRVPFAPPAQSM